MMRLQLSLFLLLPIAAFPLVSSSDVVLTQENFDEKTKGKTVFTKWFAPWCGHCKELAPKWDRMAKEWASNDGVVVGSIDCTQDEAWCVSLGISGFPTLLFGDPSQSGVFLEPYNGDKEYEALSEFANKTLNTPVCSPGNPSLCDEPEEKKINEFWALSENDLEASILEKEQMIRQTETDFKQKFDEMQAAYDKESQEHEFRLAKMKSNIRLLKRFLAVQKS